MKPPTVCFLRLSNPVVAQRKQSIDSYNKENQLFVDLKKMPGRAAEQADVVRQKYFS
ncbi:MAG: hypothetical protein V1913_12525 [Fibrobacterota bacterium]